MITNKNLYLMGMLGFGLPCFGSANKTNKTFGSANKTNKTFGNANKTNKTFAVSSKIDNDYIRKSPIEIVEILPMGMVEMKIGRKFARICEPKPWILEKGFVYLVNPDVKSTSWEDLIACDIPGFGNAKGVTDDPRLVDIGKKVFTGESWDLKPGMIISPLKKE